jgi:[ribosomal protein S5]-alanine N-acetyltransferase
LRFSPRETPRLVLRGIEIDDWQAIHRYMSDPLVTRWLPEGLLNEEQSRAFAFRNAGEKPEALAVLNRDANDLIGHMVFRPWGPPCTYEIGWVFGREHQRRGYATEAARSLLAYAFESLGSHRIIATCQPQNVSSWGVMERLGMRREGCFLKCIPRGVGEWWDEYSYAILEGEYFAQGRVDFDNDATLDEQLG